MTAPLEAHNHHPDGISMYRKRTDQFDVQTEPAYGRALRGPVIPRFNFTLGQQRFSFLFHISHCHRWTHRVCFPPAGNGKMKMK